MKKFWIRGQEDKFNRVENCLDLTRVIRCNNLAWQQQLNYIKKAKFNEIHAWQLPIAYLELIQDKPDFKSIQLKRYSKL